VGNFFAISRISYKNTIHSPTKNTLFEIIYSKPPIVPLLRTNDKIFTIDEFTLDQKTMMEKVKTTINKAQHIQ